MMIDNFSFMRGVSVISFYIGSWPVLAANRINTILYGGPPYLGIIMISQLNHCLHVRLLPILSLSKVIDNLILIIQLLLISQVLVKSKVYRSIGWQKCVSNLCSTPQIQN